MSSMRNWLLSVGSICVFLQACDSVSSCSGFEGTFHFDQPNGSYQEVVIKKFQKVFEIENRIYIKDMIVGTLNVDRLQGSCVDGVLVVAPFNIKWQLTPSGSLRTDNRLLQPGVATRRQQASAPPVPQTSKPPLASGTGASSGTSQPTQPATAQHIVTAEKNREAPKDKHSEFETAGYLWQGHLAGAGSVNVRSCGGSSCAVIAELKPEVFTDVYAKRAASSEWSAVRAVSRGSNGEKRGFFEGYMKNTVIDARMAGGYGH